MISPSTSAARLQEVAEDIYAYVQPDGGWCLNNAGLITAGAAPRSSTPRPPRHAPWLCAKRSPKSPRTIPAT